MICGRICVVFLPTSNILAARRCLAKRKKAKNCQLNKLVLMFWDTWLDLLILTIVKKNMSCIYLRFHLYLKTQLGKVMQKPENNSLTSVLASSPLTCDYCNDANWSLYKGPGFHWVEWSGSNLTLENHLFLVIVEKKQQHPVSRWVSNCNRQLDRSNSTSNAVHVVKDVSQTEGKRANERRTREIARVGTVYRVGRERRERGD